MARQKYFNRGGKYMFGEEKNSKDNKINNNLENFKEEGQDIC